MITEKMIDTAEIILDRLFFLQASKRTQCNFDNNYYNDQVCIEVTKQEGKDRG